MRRALLLLIQTFVFLWRRSKQCPLQRVMVIGIRYHAHPSPFIAPHLKRRSRFLVGCRGVVVACVGVESLNPGQSSTAGFASFPKSLSSTASLFVRMPLYREAVVTGPTQCIQRNRSRVNKSQVPDVNITSSQDQMMMTKRAPSPAHLRMTVYYA